MVDVRSLHCSIAPFMSTLLLFKQSNLTCLHLVLETDGHVDRFYADLPSCQAAEVDLGSHVREVLMTGTPSSLNGITSNQIVRLSNQTSLFHLATEHGLTTTAAYYFSAAFEPGIYLDGLSQLAIAPLVCQLLSLPLTPKMRSIPVPGFRQSVSLPRNG
jgi:hypothetical protein